jgi:hypothetical protein
MPSEVFNYGDDLIPEEKCSWKGRGEGPLKRKKRQKQWKGASRVSGWNLYTPWW